MRLERVTAEIRPRSGWEAVDLGLALVRRDFWRLLGVWWAAALPVVALVPVFGGHPLWWLLVWWWCKPAWSRLVLFHLSRRLFGERPGWRALVREAVTGGWRTFGARMVWGRLSPRRLLALPVEELEGLRGEALAQRVRLVLRRAGGSAVVLAVAAGVMSGWAAVTLLLLVSWLVPPGWARAWSDAWELWRAGGGEGLPLVLGWTVAGGWAVGMSLVDVFATGAGFGLYLNHRSWIEGWDVELVFKRLAARLRAAAAVAAVVAAVALGAWPRAAGAVEAEDPWARERETVARILEDEAFTVHRETRWEPRLREGPAPPWLELFQQVIGPLAFGLAVLTVAGLLVWFACHHRRFRGRGRRPPRRARGRPSALVVSGLGAAPGRLPADPPAVATRWWAEGRQREALALLYQAAIAWLAAHRQLDLGAAATEYDCIRRVDAADAAHAGYFRQLTETWVRLAYGGRAVGDDEMGGLCRGWPFRGGEVAG